MVLKLGRGGESFIDKPPIANLEISSNGRENYGNEKTTGERIILSHFS